jgi:hypothetical protein
MRLAALAKAQAADADRILHGGRLFSASRQPSIEGLVIPLSPLSRSEICSLSPAFQFQSLSITS